MLLHGSKALLLSLYEVQYILSAAYEQCLRSTVKILELESCYSTYGEPLFMKIWFELCMHPQGEALSTNTGLQRGHLATLDAWGLVKRDERSVAL